MHKKTKLNNASNRGAGGQARHCPCSKQNGAKKKGNLIANMIRHRRKTGGRPDVSLRNAWISKNLVVFFAEIGSEVPPAGYGGRATALLIKKGSEK